MTDEVAGVYTAGLDIDRRDHRAGHNCRTSQNVFVDVRNVLYTGAQTFSSPPCWSFQRSRTPASKSGRSTATQVYWWRRSSSTCHVCFTCSRPSSARTSPACSSTHPSLSASMRATRAPSFRRTSSTATTWWRRFHPSPSSGRRTSCRRSLDESPVPGKLFCLGH